MGAIFGIVGEADLADLAAMDERLGHRGRQNQICQVSPACWLGNRAHALPGGRFHLDDLSLVADATLYDTDALRARIEARGYRFSSEAAAELILATYRYLGLDGFSQLHGDFAVALWDGRRQALILARDALGPRPLYYWSGDGLMAFASEYKALLAIDRVPAVPDLNALQHLHHTKYLPPNQTLLEGIVALPPGKYLVFSGDHQHEGRSWQAMVDVRAKTEEEHAQGLGDALRQAVKRRVGGLDAVGINLSSGIDSTAVLATLRSEFPELPIHSFTAGYGPEDPEVLGAALVAEHCGAIHHPVIITPTRIPEILPSIVWHVEDPVGRSELAFNFEMPRLASRYVRVVVGGYGGDTILAGMSKHKILKLMEWLPPLTRPLSEFYDYSQSSTEPQTIGGQLIKTLYYRGRDTRPPEVIGSSWQPPHSRFDRNQPELINRYLLTSLQHGLRDMPKIEPPHSAHGVEVRLPFLDLDVIQTAFQIPERFKIRRWREKHILREAVKGLLPETALETPKFPAQLRSDHAFSEMMEEYARTVLTPTAISKRGFFRFSEVERLLRRTAGKPYTYEHSMRVWTLVATELWAHRFLDQRGKPPPALTSQPTGIRALQPIMS